VVAFGVFVLEAEGPLGMGLEIPNPEELSNRRQKQQIR